jgi:hypothetical protein
MPNSCIFCGKPAGSREHIWPQWILARKNFGPFRLKRAGAPAVILNNTELTTKAICGKCNTGWMSDLENEVIPILTPIFEDKPVSLDEHQQHVLAVWITKMAFLFDSTKGRNAENVFYRRPDGIALAKSRQILQFTGIWIGGLDESHRALDGADFTLKEPNERIGEGISVTLTNEHFVAQLVSLRLNETPTAPTALRLDPKPGDWGNMLIPIWPIVQPVVQWPPKVSFTNGGPRGYAYLMDRWKIGEQVDKITPSTPE